MLKKRSCRMGDGADLLTCVHRGVDLQKVVLASPFPLWRLPQNKAVWQTLKEGHAAFALDPLSAHFAGGSCMGGEGEQAECMRKRGGGGRLFPFFETRLHLIANCTHFSCALAWPVEQPLSPSQTLPAHRPLFWQSIPGSQRLQSYWPCPDLLPASLVPASF